MGLKEVIVEALVDLIRYLFSPLEASIERYGSQVLDVVVGTDAPNSVFGRPTNGVWPGLYDYYWESVVPLALALWALSIGVVILGETTSTLFSGYRTSMLKRRAFAALLGVLSWWWLAALSMQLVDALTAYLLPDLSTLSLFETASTSVVGILGVAVSLSVSNGLLAALAILYLGRRLALYMFVLLMPVLVVMWVPAVGPFAAVAELMKRLARFYVPFLFMTLPTAMLFRLGELLGQNFGLSVTGLLAWLTGLVIPILAILAPLVLFWQAGTMFSTTQRIGRQVSTGRMRHRMGRARAAGAASARRGRGFASGVRRSSSIDNDDRGSSKSGGSRADGAGSRVARAREYLSPFRARATDGGRPTAETPQANQATSREQSFTALRATERPSPLPPAPTSQDATDSDTGRDTGDPTRLQEANQPAPEREREDTAARERNEATSAREWGDVVSERDS